MNPLGVPVGSGAGTDGLAGYVASGATDLRIAIDAANDDERAATRAAFAELLTD